MKNILLFVFALYSLTIFAQEAQTADSTLTTTSQDAEADSTADSSEFSLNTGFGLFSRYLWRGVKFGTGPSAQGFMELSHESGFGIGSYVCSNFAGSFGDFGNTSNLYIWYTTALGEDAEITFVLDDYYFYDEDNFDMTFDYSDTTLHYIEARVQGRFGRLDATVGYSVYQGSVRDETTNELVAQDTAPYIEIGYAVNEDTRIFAGGVTGASALNFQTKEGISNVGISHKREIKSTPVYTTFVVNPSYKNIGSVTGFRQPGRSAISLVVAIKI